jgi:hypothetical protein
MQYPQVHPDTSIIMPRKGENRIKRQECSLRVRGPRLELEERNADHIQVATESVPILL